MKYTLTLDAIEKQLRSRTKVSLALDGWTSTNTLCITLVITNYNERNWGFHQVEHAFDEVDRLFFLSFEL